MAAVERVTGSRHAPRYPAIPSRFVKLTVPPGSGLRPPTSSPNHRHGRCSRWVSSAWAGSACADARGRTSSGYGNPFLNSVSTNVRPEPRQQARHGDSFRLDRNAGSRYERRSRETRRANVSQCASSYSIAAIVSRAIRPRALICLFIASVSAE